MNKIETAEIRKQFDPDRCTIERICTCYVGSEKEKRFMSRDSFLSLPEEEMHKYLAFFKKALTGTIGKNLMNLQIPLSEEMPGGKQEFLVKLRDSELADDEMLEAFYDKIIEHYDQADKYCIFLVYAVYDVPGKGLDGLTMDDASDSVYRYMLCCLCPVELSKGALGYDTEENRIGELTRQWVVGDPDKAFLFPSFAERMSNIHELLYYSKKAGEIQPDLIEFLFGAEPPLTADEQKDTFNLLVSDMMGEDGDMEIMKNVHDSLTGLIEENKANPEPLSMGSAEVKQLLKDSGINGEGMERFEDRFEELAGDKAEIMVANLPGIKTFNISTPDIEIHVKPDYVDRIEARVIDGRDCLVITVDDHVEVNGVNVKTLVK
ncbi:MAG: DUF4317 domain-containing protein [Lachnospiraceae bacterium]|nr:DUF4317 domain-containing protein [Lachnospiraceae bacterium]